MLIDPVAFDVLARGYEVRFRRFAGAHGEGTPKGIQHPSGASNIKAALVYLEKEQLIITASQPN